MQRGRSKLAPQTVPATQSSLVTHGLSTFPMLSPTHLPFWHVPPAQQSASVAQPLAHLPPAHVASQEQSSFVAQVSTQNPSAPQANPDPKACPHSASDPHTQVPLRHVSPGWQSPSPVQLGRHQPRPGLPVIG